VKRLRVLHQDDDIVAVQKPSGMHVHPPEDSRHRTRDDEVCLKVLRQQLDQYLYPVHRLDRPTSGVLVFALNPRAASHLCAQFEQRSVGKRYIALVRGWPAGAEHPGGLLIDRPLGGFESATRVRMLARWLAPWTNSKFPASRYSLLAAEPLTGRLHQIRRHLAGIGHPVLGDTQRGDGEHNRLLRQHWQSRRLWLHALSLDIEHPGTAMRITLRSPFPPDWHRAFDAFGLCPIAP
jgi:tRNA pseudouridine65 synthase